jgi:hypothetical protein
MLLIIKTLRKKQTGGRPSTTLPDGLVAQNWLIDPQSSSS